MLRLVPETPHCRSPNACEVGVCSRWTDLIPAYCSPSNKAIRWVLEQNSDWSKRTCISCPFPIPALTGSPAASGSCSSQTSIQQSLKCCACSNRADESIFWRGAGSSVDFWQYFQEISTLFHPLMRAIPVSMRPKVDEAVDSAVARFQQGNT